jgi:hypothetical protein
MRVPDGREIRVRSLDALDAVTALSTTSFIRGLITSPDGEWIGFVENNYVLKKIPILGRGQHHHRHDGRTVARRRLGAGPRHRLRNRGVDGRGSSVSPPTAGR